MSKPMARTRSFAFAFPNNLSAEEKRHKELQEKYREMKRSLAEKKAAMDKNEKNKSGKRTVEEAEEATSELIKKVQEGKITMKKSDDKHTFKRARLSSTAEGGRLTRSLSEDGEIMDPHDDELESSSSANYWNQNNSWNQQNNWQQGWSQNRPDNSQRTIYVKGYELQREILRETFEKYGNIRRINMGEKNRHAFVEFNHQVEAETAIREMDGNMMQGTAIHVSFAKRKEQNFNDTSRGVDNYNPAATPRVSSYIPATSRLDSYNSGATPGAFEDLEPSNIV